MVRLMSIPAPFDGYIEHSKRVLSTSLIIFDNSRYSVPASFTNRPTSLHIHAHKLVMIAEEKVIAEHQRMFTRDHSQKGKQSMASITTRRYCSVSPVRCAMGHPSRNCQRASANYKNNGSSIPVTTRIWSMYWH